MNRSVLLAKPKEITWGWRYLAFQVTFFEYFLGLAVKLLQLPWNALQLNFLYFSVNLVAAMVIFHRFWISSFRALLDRIGTILLTAGVGYVAYYILSFLVAIFIVTVDPGFANVNDQSISDLSRQHYMLTAIGTVLLVPTAEELLHRGAIFGGLYQKNRIAAYTVSTLLFALVHVSGYIGYYPIGTLLLCLLQYIPAGICLAASYEFSGNIFTPILIHTAVNAVGILAMR